MKKQIAILNWNIERNDLKLDLDLEAQMLSEESTEFFDAFKDTLFTDFYTPLDRLVDTVDAYCDYIFVLRGTQGKVLATQFDNASDYIRATALVEQATQMGFMLLEILNKEFPHIDEDDLDYCLELVVKANQAKPVSKTSGKVKKGILWEDPKEAMRTYFEGGI